MVSKVTASKWWVPFPHNKWKCRFFQFKVCIADEKLRHRLSTLPTSDIPSSPGLCCLFPNVNFGSEPEILLCDLIAMDTMWCNGRPPVESGKGETVSFFHGKYLGGFHSNCEDIFIDHVNVFILFSLGFPVIFLCLKSATSLTSAQLNLLLVAIERRWVVTELDQSFTV